MKEYIPSPTEERIIKDFLFLPKYNKVLESLINSKLKDGYVTIKMGDLTIDFEIFSIVLDAYSKKT